MTFQQDLTIGERAEVIFASWLREKGLESIANIDKTNKYFDILIPAKTYEIKCDRYTEANGNIAVELMSDRNALKLGWIYYSTANTLIYFITENSPYKFYEIDMNYLKRFVELNREKYQIKQASIAGSNSTIMLIPAKDLEGDKCKLKVIL